MREESLKGEGCEIVFSCRRTTSRSFVEYVPRIRERPDSVYLNEPVWRFKITRRLSPLARSQTQRPFALITVRSLQLFFSFLNIVEVANENTSQEEMFQLVGLPITQTCLEGFNGTIICYGQTGSGKSYTTFGATDAKSIENRGLVPRVLEYLWEHIALESSEESHVKCKCSFYEIYQERVYDLLVGSKYYSTLITKANMM